MYNKQFFDSLSKIILVKGTKNKPTHKFSKEKNTNNNKTVESILKQGNNVAIRTGKTNNLTVVDLDIHKEGFKFDFDIDELCKTTYWQKSASGGIHLFYLYDKDIKQGQNGKIQVDTRNEDNGYIIFDGSKFKDKKYEGQNDLIPSKIPEDVKKFLLDNGYDNTKFETKEKKIDSNITIKDVKIKKDKNLFIPKSHLKQILDEKPLTFFNDVEFWKFTTIMKYLDAYDLWDEFNKKRDEYDLNENIKIWNSVNPNRCNINLLIDLFNNKNFRSYYNLKHLPQFSLESQKINKQKLGYDFIEENINYIIKSDTGTGKTTSVKHFLHKTNDIFISIVSRRSLGQEQYNNFNTDDFLKCDYYEYVDYIKNKDNIVIQLDSILRIRNNIDLSKYILVLDEFESIIHYLFTSSTLKKNRILIFIRFIEILKQCKNFICIDADITNKSIEFIATFINREYNLFENSYKHNKGVNAYEIEKEDVFFNFLKQEDKFLLCCDSKKTAEYIEEKLNNETIDIIHKEIIEEFENMEENECEKDILDDTSKNFITSKIMDYLKSFENYEELLYNEPKKLITSKLLEIIKLKVDDEKYNYLLELMDSGCNFIDCIKDIIIYNLEDKHVVCITSDTDEYYNFDEHNKIIYSPKIIYGIDSSMKRNVYCFYKEHTINTKQMVQQVARCRNITNLYFHFTKKEYQPNNITYDEVLKRNIEIVDYGINNQNNLIETNFRMIDENIEKKYIKLFSKFEYEDACYNTNKFCHMLKLLEERGFILKTYRLGKDIKKHFVERTKSTPKDFFTKERNKRILDIIGMNMYDSVVNENFEIIKDHNFVQTYVNIKQFFFDKLDDNVLLEKINNQEEFILTKTSSNTQKLRLLLKLKEMTGCKDRNNIFSTVLLNEEQINKFKYEYHMIFEKNKYYDEKFKFDTLYNQDKIINKLYKRIFTKDINESDKKRIDGKQRYVYYLNQEEYNLYENMFCFKRHRKNMKGMFNKIKSFDRKQLNKIRYYQIVEENIKKSKKN